MHPRIQEVLNHLDTGRADLRAAVDAVPALQRSARPAPDRWSAAEVLEHLAMVEGRMARGIFARRIEEARANGLGAERDTSPVAPTFDASHVRDRTQPRVAPEPVVPQGGKDAATAWAELEQIREGLRATIVSADGLALGDVIHVHPTLGSMNMYQWALWIAGHEGRHAAQVREIASALSGNR